MKTSEKTPKTKVINKLAIYMGKRKITPVDFAKAMGVSYQSINNWMVNRSQPKLENLWKAGKILGVDPKKLILFNVTWDTKASPKKPKK